MFITAKTKGDKMNKEMQAAIEASPVFSKITKAMNEMVDEANARGVTIPEQVRQAMQNMRMYATLLKDETVKTLFANSVFESLQKTA